ncbi:nucleotide exchange factor GrpE [Paenibacillus dakarensis]|uniref:nucleotide exchange factor GrpE n=1 Tax=Paenibacillus dakarensis TaxID=1527293 RepID=UPI000A6B46E4
MNKDQNKVQDTVNEETLEHAVPETGEHSGTQGTDEQSSVKENAEGSLQVEVEKLKNELSEQQQRALRAQADFDNFRKRTLKEKEELAKYASSKLITELLPVIDNFERALAATEENPEFESFSKGVNMIFRQLENILQAEGLTPMNCVGQPFNPEFHQAIMQVESEEYEEGIVVEEVQKGFMLKDKVLRPAMVKVSM